VFSTRTPPHLAPNRLAQALLELQRADRRVIDLTESNPTRAGFQYPPDLLAPLADVRGLTYLPRPFGLIEARRAVAQALRSTGRSGISSSSPRSSSVWS